MRREPILLIFSTVVAGAYGWYLYSDATNPLRKPAVRKSGSEVTDLRVPDLTKVPVPQRPDGRRDLFGEPRDTRPLPKLAVGPELPLPEPEAYTWLSPSPVPGPSSAYWHRWLRVPAKPE